MYTIYRLSTNLYLQLESFFNVMQQNIIKFSLSSTTCCSVNNFLVQLYNKIHKHDLFTKIRTLIFCDVESNN